MSHGLIPWFGPIKMIGMIGEQSLQVGAIHSAAHAGTDASWGSPARSLLHELDCMARLSPLSAWPTRNFKLPSKQHAEGHLQAQRKLSAIRKKAGLGPLSIYAATGLKVI